MKHLPCNIGNHQLAQKEMQRHILENTLDHIPPFDENSYREVVNPFKPEH